jgi:hypothetical protein
MHGRGRGIDPGGERPGARARRRRSPALLAAFLLAAAAARAAGEAGGPAPPPAALAVGLGAFDVANPGPLAEVGLELRLAPRGPLALIPAVGGAINDAGDAYLYGGLAKELPLAPGWFLTPGVGIGVYGHGDDEEGVDLGGAVEFRSILELAREFRPGTRVGLAFYHLSNGGLYDLNPGSNSAILTVSFGLGR